MKIIPETNSLIFRNIFDGLEIIPQNKYPESIFWGKNGIYGVIINWFGQNLT